MIEAPKKKLTVSLSQDDLDLIAELANLTGAYTVSEVVRNALRMHVDAEREKKK